MPATAMAVLCVHLGIYQSPLIDESDFVRYSILQIGCHELSIDSQLTSEV